MLKLFKQYIEKIVRKQFSFECKNLIDELQESQMHVCEKAIRKFETTEAYIDKHNFHALFHKEEFLDSIIKRIKDKQLP